MISNLLARVVGGVLQQASRLLGSYGVCTENGFKNRCIIKSLWRILTWKRAEHWLSCMQECAALCWSKFFFSRSTRVEHCAAALRRFFFDTWLYKSARDSLQEIHHLAGCWGRVLECTQENNFWPKHYRSCSRLNSLFIPHRDSAPGTLAQGKLLLDRRRSWT